MLPDLRHLTREEWHLLRQVRLTALSESPTAFLATHEKELSYGQDRWMAEFDRGNWIIGEIQGRPVSLVGIVRAPDSEQDERYLEYVWVAPDRRRDHIAFDVLTWVLLDLTRTGIRTVFLWVLDGNDAASWLYKRLDFTTTNDRQPLPADPSRCEERLKRELAWPAPTVRPARPHETLPSSPVSPPGPMPVDHDAPQVAAVRLL